jgi:hypothetical protein
LRPLSEWLKFRADLDRLVVGECSDEVCRALVDDRKREAEAEIARFTGDRP